ncbi:hypothetical protein [Arthrobacter sp. U41]|uniref:hypothetical protein n=1 Tax=Arthrobacter sp. U41 TaxID=1849032 RepID=UPI0011A67ED4|nr:hypothetical protein [Arthrobacter sp. U41]
MAALGGPARYGKRTTPTLLSLGWLAVVALTAACGAAPSPVAAAHEQSVIKPPAATGAGLSPGMTHAPRPPVPPAPAGQGADGCSSPRAEDAAAAGGLECQYFTSGSMMPAAVPRGPGMSSGDYAVRFGSVGGHPLMTVRIPCASYAVRVSFEGETITPDPATLESFQGTCDFPWGQEQARMHRYLQAPLQFARRESGIVLHNPEWGVTLFSTPYEAT